MNIWSRKFHNFTFFIIFFFYSKNKNKKKGDEMVLMTQFLRLFFQFFSRNVNPLTKNAVVNIEKIIKFIFI